VQADGLGLDVGSKASRLTTGTNWACAGIGVDKVAAGSGATKATEGGTKLGTAKGAGGGARAGASTTGANEAPSVRARIIWLTHLCRLHERRAQPRPQNELNSRPTLLAAKRKSWRINSSPSALMAPKVSRTRAEKK